MTTTDTPCPPDLLATMSDRQREILGWLADHWELLRWRCNDGIYRWHMGEMAVDGRAVRGLWQRGLVEIDMMRRLPSLVLTTTGKAALGTPTNDDDDDDAGERR